MSQFDTTDEWEAIEVEAEASIGGVAYETVVHAGAFGGALAIAGRREMLRDLAMVRLVDEIVGSLDVTYRTYRVRLRHVEDEDGNPTSEEVFRRLESE